MTTKTEALKQARNSLCDIDNALFAEGKRTPAYVEQAIAAIDAVLAEPEPDADWQLVPKVPTENMLQAAAREHLIPVHECVYDIEKLRRLSSEDLCKQVCAARYQSMLAAAPSKAPQ